MSHELICTWLDLPAGEWPPDHYRLLGLQRGAADAAQIEACVHERLMLVRRYQLTHPEPATEAMNRLAQAFVCLSDRAAKRAYDDALLGNAPAGGAVATAEAAPVPAPEPAADFVAATAPSAQTLPEAPSAPAPASAPPHAATAREERLARRGLGTKRALYHRVAQTRRLIRAWEEAGEFLGQPDRRVGRPAEATELIRRLAAVRDLLRDFPRLLGEAGQPGYLVVALARQPAVVPMFQTLLPSQREALARDWRNAQRTLTAHRQFLREELRGLRRKSTWGRAVRAARAFLNEHPAALLLLLALLALNIAVWRTQFSDGPPSDGPPTDAAPSRPADE